MSIPRVTMVEGDTGKVWQRGHRTNAAHLRPAAWADLTGDFTCFIGVAPAEPGGESPLQRAVTAKNTANTHFLAWLTPEETAALGPGLWLVGIELRNAALTPPLISEEQHWLEIVAGAVRGDTAPGPDPDPGFAPSLNFTDARNSQYLGAL